MSLSALYAISPLIASASGILTIPPVSKNGGCLPTKTPPKRVFCVDGPIYFVNFVLIVSYMASIIKVFENHFPVNLLGGFLYSYARGLFTGVSFGTATCFYSYGEEYKELLNEKDRHSFFTRLEQLHRRHSVFMKSFASRVSFLVSVVLTLDLAINLYMIPIIIFPKASLHLPPVVW